MISSLFKLYLILILAFSHSSLMTCKYGLLKKSYGEFDWQQIDAKLIERCPTVSHPPPYSN